MTVNSTSGRIAAMVAALTLAMAACAGGSGRTPESDAAPVITGGDPIAGEQVYIRSCAPCHGANLEGNDGLGNALSPSAFIISRTTDELATYVLVGLPADDPQNMTGLDMPAKGGNPSLTDEDIDDVIAYLILQQ